MGKLRRGCDGPDRRGLIIHAGIADFDGASFGFGEDLVEERVLGRAFAFEVLLSLPKLKLLLARRGNILNVYRCTDRLRFQVVMNATGRDTSVQGSVLL
jgi:hypothetical protein